MVNKTKEELEAELNLLTALNEQRDISDKRYAIKLVEIVVWGMVGIILTAFLIAILAVVVK